MTDQPSTSDDDDDDDDYGPRVLPDPPMDLYLDYDPETDAYYGSSTKGKYDFDFDGWRYNFLLEKRDRGEVLTRYERDFVRWQEKSRAQADARRGGEVKNNDGGRQRDLFSDLPDEDNAPAQQSPTADDAE